MPPELPPTFANLYCQEYRLDLERFTTSVLRSSLYPHARPFYGVISRLWPSYFAADQDLIRSAGLLRHVRDLQDDLSDYLHHPANTGLARRLFRIRISTTRFRRIVREALHHSTSNAPRPAT